MRCSNHPLAIEKGRQKNPKTPREHRLCVLCNEQAIEDEDHFLPKCTTYSHVDYYNMAYTNVPDTLSMDDQYKLAKFLTSALELL